MHEDPTTAPDEGLLELEVDPLASPHPARDDAPAESVIGSSPTFRQATQHLPAIIASSAPVLLLGESGTGKELLARTIHRLGARRLAPFIAVNCAAVPSELFESELFGHSDGAFSSASRMKRGLIEMAHRGTLLLDEIGELPPALRPKLLRVLDDQEIRRLGETRGRKVDFRLICATNEDLPQQVEHGRFRSDLFYRINVFTMTLPPLRKRVSDIAELAQHLVVRAAERAGRPRPVLSPAATDLLVHHPWPGNVRELANVLERAVAVAGDGLIEPHHLGRELTPNNRPQRGTLRQELTQLEHQILADALAKHDGNITIAARHVGIARQALQRLMRKHGLTVESRA